MQVHKFEIKTLANVCTIGDPAKAKYILFALHGYGQLSQYFIRKFRGLSDDYFIVVPEALHRFYLSGSSGRVGASWMTKEKRTDDILNYINYLNEVADAFLKQNQFEKRILLGFSQGGATASRWQKMGNFDAHKFILWGAVFPDDLEQNWENKFAHSENYFVVGDNDPYYSEEKTAFQIQYFEQKNVNFKAIKYNGEHNIDQQTLLNLCP